MISVVELCRIMPQCPGTIAQRFAGPLDDAMSVFDIGTPLRRRCFLAQIAHESGQLRYTREVWGPTAAQRRYDQRDDLGNCEVGDGERFLGRGLLQITGRANYRLCSNALYGDDSLLDTPELLEDPDGAAQSAGWFWYMRGLNELADDNDFERITLRINGSTRTVPEREIFLVRACEVIA